MTEPAGTRDRAVWQLFSDWCAASGESALPAAPETLARFVAANPASLRTHRRRVSVINAAHRRVGVGQPGRAEVVRALLDSRRAERRHRLTVSAAAAILRLPNRGWPTELFARRDAMLLVLVTMGLSSIRIEALRLADLRVDPPADRLRVSCASGETFCTPADLTAHGVSPVRTYQQWLRIRSIQHHLSSPRFLAAYLRDEPIPPIADAPASLPVVTSIDRWGASPFYEVPLGAQSISRICATHLAGAPALHRPVQLTAPVIEDVPDLDLPSPGSASELDTESYSRGIAARYRAATELDGITATLDDVEDRADRLLTELLQLLDDQN